MIKVMIKIMRKNGDKGESMIEMVTIIMKIVTRTWAAPWSQVGNNDDGNNNQNDDDDDQRPELCHEARIGLDRWTSRSNHGKSCFHWYSVLQMISVITICQERAEFQINFDCRKPLPWEKRWRQSLSASDRSNSGPVLRPGSGPGEHDDCDYDVCDVDDDNNLWDEGKDGREVWKQVFSRDVRHLWCEEVSWRDY